MNALPRGWITTTLGKICSKPQYGWTCRAAKTGQVRYLRTTDISRGSIRWEDVPYCEEPPDDIEKYHVYHDDILVARAGSVGVSYRIEEVPFDTVFASYLIRFNALDGIEPKYIELFLKSQGYWLSIYDFAAGIAIPNVNASKLASLQLPLAPVNEQRRIVAKLEKLLEKVDGCRTRLEKIPVILKRFRQALLAAACSGRLTADWRENNLSDESIDATIEVIYRRRETDARSMVQKDKLREVFSISEQNDSGELPDGWRFVTLSKLCSSFDYGTSAKSKPSGKVPVLRMGNIQDGKIDWTNLVYTSADKEIQKYFLRPNTVLFNRTNSPELVGKTAIYRGEQPAIFAGYLIRINHCPELDPKYLNLCLNTSYAREFCQNVKTDGVSQSNINAQKLASFEVPFCPLPAQHEIVRRVEGLFALADQIEGRYKRAKAHIDKLTQSILAKAFRGELVPQDPNEQPAEELLKQIHAEKQKVTSQRASQRSKGEQQ